MFSLYIDDSGTSPSNPVALATAFIIPAAQIVRLEKEWDTFRTKENFNCFHTSEFMARNPKSEFATWDDAKQERVFRRVRQISKKYGRAVSIAVNKKDYNEIVPPELRSFLGPDHYTWAVRQLIAHLHEVDLSPQLQREFIFQWLELRDRRRKEIEIVMDQMQFLADKNKLAGSYYPNFRKSSGIPALQCVDAIAWVCYQYSLLIFRKIPLKRFVSEAWHDFDGHLGNGWLRAAVMPREKLQKAVQKAIADGKAMDFFNEWKQARKR